MVNREVKIKAFIGHSFAEKDEALVNEILAFLTLKAEVDCVTGLKEQNKSVSKKVREQIESAEIFIGIFTKDQAIQLPETPRSFFGFQRPSQQPPLFTTSNWVIQESGYALGKGKELVLLVEEEIHRFPELQGDVEVIPFNRNRIDEALLKLSIVIQGLRAGERPSSGEAAASAPEKIEEDEQANERASEPALHQALDDMLRAHDERDSAKAEEIYKKRVRDLIKPENVPFFDTLVLSWKYYAGDFSALEELKKKAEGSNNPDIYGRLADCYAFSGKHDLAISALSESIKHSTKPADRVVYLVKSAEFYAEKDMSRAISTLIASLTDSSYEGCRREIFKALAKVTDGKGNDYFYFIFAELALDENPVDTDIRFRLAYKYYEAGEVGLALFHYKQVIRSIEHGAALNNLALAYSGLDMKAKGVAYYERAINQRETIALGNVAYKFLEEGFTKKAEELIQQAEQLGREGVELHSRVNEAKTQLSRLLQEEKVKETKILESLQAVLNFNLQHAQGYLKPAKTDQPIDLSGVWELPSWGQVKIVHDQKTGNFSGQSETPEEVPMSALEGFALGQTFGGGTRPKRYVTRRVKISGEIQNFSGRYTLAVTRDGTTILTSGQSYEAQGRFVVNETGNVLSVLEQDSSKKDKFKEKSFFEWRRISGSA